MGVEVLDQPFLNQEFKLLDRYELQSELVEVVQKTARHSHLVQKLAACHRSFRHRRCENHHSHGCRDWAKPFNSCSIRICPHCAHRRSEILAHRIQEFVVGKTGLRYAVLAERNSESLEEGIASLWKAWTRLRRFVGWKRKVKGAIVALEVTYNREQGTWHPHLNVLMEGEYFPFLELQQLWALATHERGRTSYIRAANEGTVFELIKYTLKVAEKDESGEQTFRLILSEPEQLDEFLSAVQGRRLVRTYGTFRGIVIGDEENPEDAEKCPDCGSSCFVDLGFVRPEQIALDFEKNCLRVKRPPGQVRAVLRDAAAFYPEWIESQSNSERRRVQSMHEGRVEASWRRKVADPQTFASWIELERRNFRVFCENTFARQQRLA